MQDNKSSYSYDATGQSATGFQCDEVVQSTTGISLADVESGNSAAKSQFHCIRPRVSSISTGVVCCHIDPETKDLGLLTRSSGLAKHGHAPLGFEYSVGLQVVRLPISVGDRSQLVSAAVKTGRQWRNNIQYNQLHVCVCVCAPSWDISMQMSTLSTQSYGRFWA